ncbi:hypothetical protein F2Q69_00020836 [Brassica cretica]|uniref:Uncharacterized protein n=1 Tax=Brassica cretica TaxID=69181 RepID=A0A8S9Q9L8_BRACR|nr:hypothetical protein F2Q69_00020836 [Brassica cretica]
MKILSTILGNIDEQAMPTPPQISRRRVSSREQGNKVSAEIGVVAVVAGVERIRESMLSIGTTGWVTPCLRS